MGTKLNPGEFDCYSKAEPNEELFTLRAKDSDASILVKMWAFFRMQQINAGLRPESDRAQVSEAMRCATRMEIWHTAYIQREKHLSLEYDNNGVPTTGPNSSIAAGNTNTYGVTKP